MDLSLTTSRTKLIEAEEENEPTSPPGVLSNLHEDVNDSSVTPTVSLPSYEEALRTPVAELPLLQPIHDNDFHAPPPPSYSEVFGAAPPSSPQVSDEPIGTDITRVVIVRMLAERIAHHFLQQSAEESSPTSQRSSESGHSQQRSRTVPQAQNCRVPVTPTRVVIRSGNSGGAAKRRWRVRAIASCSIVGVFAVLCVVIYFALANSKRSSDYSATIPPVADTRTPKPWKSDWLLNYRPDTLSLPRDFYLYTTRNPWERLDWQNENKYPIEKPKATDEWLYNDITTRRPNYWWEAPRRTTPKPEFGLQLSDSTESLLSSLIRREKASKIIADWLKKKKTISSLNLNSENG